MWLQNEGRLNEIVVELHERAKWKQTTNDGTRSFTIPFPSFGATGALHLQDVAKHYLEDDPLGVLSRLLLQPVQSPLVDDESQNLFRHIFGAHCEQQESNYLLDSTVAKFHGKAKTKFL